MEYESIPVPASYPGCPLCKSLDHMGSKALPQLSHVNESDYADQVSLPSQGYIKLSIFVLVVYLFAFSPFIDSGMPQTPQRPLRSLCSGLFRPVVSFPHTDKGWEGKWESGGAQGGLLEGGPEAGKMDGGLSVESHWPLSLLPPGNGPSEHRSKEGHGGLHGGDRVPGG